MIRALAACLLVACAGPSFESSPKIRFVGRVDRSDPQGPRFAWSGSSFSLRFVGTRIQLELRDLQKAVSPEGLVWPNRFRVVVDGVAKEPDVVAVDGRASIDLRLALGVHAITVFKQTEAHVGATQLVSVKVSPVERLLDPPPPALHRILFVGDSLSTGYGNEGTAKSCPFSHATQNHWLAYPSLVARALAAEHQVVAWSGKGVVQNYRNPKEPRIPAQNAREAWLVPDLLDRVLPDDPRTAPWDFSAWTPEVIVVSLGFNDISAVDPGPRFEGAYQALLHRLQRIHPSARVICIVPPVDDEWPPELHARTTIRRYIEAAAAGRKNVSVIELPPIDPAQGLGCDWHPTLARHRTMARAVIGAIAFVTGWSSSSVPL